MIGERVFPVEQVRRTRQWKRTRPAGHKVRTVEERKWDIREWKDKCKTASDKERSLIKKIWKDLRSQSQRYRKEEVCVINNEGKTWEVKSTERRKYMWQTIRERLEKSKVQKGGSICDKQWE